ncbi:MAG: 50S ribosomal protein L24e [Candidatus Woesearchaeota archaeon]
MKCSFSGEDIPLGTGKMFVKKDGTILWFSSSKSQKNMLKLGRKPNKTRWTEESKETKKATMAALKHEEEAEHDPVKESPSKAKKSAQPKKKAKR